MPLILPEPHEVVRMDRRQRDMVIARLRAYERALGVYLGPAKPRTALTEQARAERDRAWGERVRAEARALAGES